MLKEAPFKLGPFAQSEETALMFTCVSQSCKSTISSFRSFSSLLHHTHKDELSVGPALSSRKGKWRFSVDSPSCMGHSGPAHLAWRGAGSAGGSRGALSTRHLPRGSEVLAPCHSPPAQRPALASSCRHSRPPGPPDFPVLAPPSGSSTNQFVSPLPPGSGYILKGLAESSRPDMGTGS